MDTDAKPADTGTVRAAVVRFFFVSREADGLVVATIATTGDARQARRCAAANGLGIGSKYHAREISSEQYAHTLERSGFTAPLNPGLTDTPSAGAGR